MLLNLVKKLNNAGRTKTGTKKPLIDVENFLLSFHNKELQKSMQLAISKDLSLAVRNRNVEEVKFLAPFIPFIELCLYSIQFC